MTETTNEAKAIIVTMENGEVKNFGTNGRLLSTQNVTDQGLEVVFHVVTGEQVTFNVPSEGTSAIILEAAAYGFAAKAKNATAGTPVDKIAEVVKAKVAEFERGVWVTRGNVGESLVPLTQTATAYALVNGIDPYTTEGIAKTNAIFSALTKEEKANLAKDPKVQVAVAQLRLDAAIALASATTEEVAEVGSN